MPSKTDYKPPFNNYPLKIFLNLLLPALIGKFSATLLELASILGKLLGILVVH